MIVYRVQDAQGRGPWKPGLSRHWVESRPQLSALRPIFEEVDFTRYPKGMHLGCGCKSLDDLKHWFTPLEYLTLLSMGYRAVSMEVNELVGEGAVQCLFARRKPLAVGVTEIALYGQEQVA